MAVSDDDLTYRDLPVDVFLGDMGPSDELLRSVKQVMRSSESMTQVLLAFGTIYNDECEDPKGSKLLLQFTREFARHEKNII